MHLTPFILVALTTAVLIWLMGMLWRRYYGVDSTSLLATEQFTALTAVLGEFGFNKVQTRPLFRARSLWSSLHHESFHAEVEFCDGNGADYTRITCSFETSLGQGFQILCEEGAGLWGWLLSMNVTRVDDEVMEARFILMSKNKERLLQLLKSPLRAHIMALRDEVEDFQLTDQALYVYTGRVVQGEALRRLLEDVLVLTSSLVMWSMEKGPITSLQTSQYQDALAEMDMYATRTHPSGFLPLQEGEQGPEEKPVDMLDAEDVEGALMEPRDGLADSSPQASEEE